MDVNKKTQRNRFTRMCIGEAIVELMKRDSLDKITVSQIAKKAGISRMTYYHYYDSKVNAIEDYLREIIIQYLEKMALNRLFFIYRKKLNIYHSICIHAIMNPIIKKKERCIV